MNFIFRHLAVKVQSLDYSTQPKGQARVVALRSPKLKAFTLIELLVVITIISILAALLMPSLLTGKQKAQGIKCMNNGRQMILALHLYSADYNDWLPPNPEHELPIGWVKGSMRIPEEATNVLFLTDPKYAKLAPYTRGNADIYKCPGDKSMVTIANIKYPRVRTFSMNQAVGTKPDPPTSAVDGARLDGTHNHLANQPWRTYGRFGDIVDPSPSKLWIFLDEDEFSINDAAFAVQMISPTAWLDWPGTYHDFSCGLAFSDGHSEIHKWTDPRTKVIGGNVKARNQPNNSDIAWLQSKTSANALKPTP